MKTITREQMKVMESSAMSKFKIPGLLLMENAGTRVADACMDYLKELEKDLTEAKVVVVCGVGNNGGDGAVVARHLHNMGVHVEVVVTRDLHRIFSELVDAEDLQGSATGGMGEDTTLNLKILKQMNVTVHVVSENDFFHRFFVEADLIVDGLLGTGLNTGLGKIKSPTKDLIVAINELDIPVVSIDLPSGLDCNSGDLVGLCVQASKTVTFSLPKQGFFKSVGPSVCGDIIVANISIPRQLIENLKQE